MDRELETHMAFFAWMLQQQDGGFNVRGVDIMTRWLVDRSTAYRWRDAYFKTRGLFPMRHLNGSRFSEVA